MDARAGEHRVETKHTASHQQCCEFVDLANAGCSDERNAPGLACRFHCFHHCAKDGGKVCRGACSSWRNAVEANKASDRVLVFGRDCAVAKSVGGVSIAHVECPECHAMRTIQPEGDTVTPPSQVKQSPTRQESKASTGSSCHALRSAAAACPHALLRGDAPNLAPLALGEPQFAIRPGRDEPRLATGCGDVEKGEAAAGRHAPNVAHLDFRKPEVAIGARRDTLSPAGSIPVLIPTDSKGDLGDTATSADVPDLVHQAFGEQECTIRASRDTLRPAPGRGDGERGDAATGGNAPDVVRLGEPEIAIWASRDTPGQASRRERGDATHCGLGGSAAQAQQAGTGNYGGEKCSQARPPSRTVHGSPSLM